jgi:hypothetical protein
VNSIFRSKAFIITWKFLVILIEVCYNSFMVKKDIFNARESVVKITTLSMGGGY